MITPTKYIPVSHSLLGVCTSLLPMLRRPQTVSTLWEDARRIAAIGNYPRFVLCLDLLFILGVIELKDGLLVRRAR